MSSNVKNIRRFASRNGFTLIELLLVLVILGVLAAVVVPKFTGKTETARIGAAKASISNLSTSLNNFEVECGRFPTTEEGLNALLAAPASATGWHGPYIEASALKDPWEQPFVYQYPGTHNPSGFDLFSAGPDKQTGTQDDIGNWPAESQ